MKAHRRDENGGWAPVPAVYPGAEGRPGPVLCTLEVDGELFAVRPAAGGGTSYDWLSGPNAGYGFACSGPPGMSPDDHERHIRAFLSMIDPATGYIEDD